MLTIETLVPVFTVCQVPDCAEIDLNGAFCFTARTDEEISLVCPAEAVPRNTVRRDDGWRGFRVQGVLDFSLIGILARIADVLAAEEISIFAVSTYNTDYILVRQNRFADAAEALRKAGFSVIG
ncbi:MAG: ACT domain-containing protein [Clostridia bacterium]|nr:ACT domain-containing protein [Clostridia bacterium]